MKLKSTLLRAKLLISAQVVVALAFMGGMAQAQTGPGSGVNVLANPGFETGTTSGWTVYGQASVISTNATYYNGGGGGSNVVAHSGAYTGNSYNSDFSGGSVNTNGMYQTFSTASGSTYWAYGWAYSSPEDLMGGACSFWFELGFYNINNQLISLWASSVYTNAGTTFPDNVWLYFPITNEWQVNNPGTATASVSENVIADTGTSGIVTAPSGATSVRYQVCMRAMSNEGGSVYYDDLYLDKVSGASPPYITNLTALNNVILATNTSVSYTVVSPAGLDITNAQVVATTISLSSVTNTVTNSLTSTNISVSGLNTSTAVVTFQLQSNLMYNLTVIGTDQGGNSVSEQATFDTIQPTLVVEAEDFNYSGGQWTPTPPDGGVALYLGDVGEQGIDENKTYVAGQGAKSYYRPGDAVIIQGAAPNNGTEQKYITSEANGDTNDVPLEVGYNSAGDWLDYTRSFPAGSYNVFGRLATDGSGQALAFYQITSDPTQANQTTTQLGTFSFADNNWNTYDYVPLLDQYGKLASINLSGTETFRSEITGNPNIDFYFFVPVVPILTPELVFAYPDGTHPFEPTNNFTFTIGAANGAGIQLSGIDVLLNGADVTSKIQWTGSTNSWTGNYPIASNAVYAAMINVTNEAGLSSQIAINFDTFNISNYQWEAEDYDFSTNTDGTSTNQWVSGLYIDNPVPTADAAGVQGTVFIVATNSYFAYPMGFTPEVDPAGYGSMALQGADVSYAAASGMQEAYRVDSVGTQIAADWLRPKFTAAQKEFGDGNISDFNLGWFDGGDWVNYTRDWPTNSYYVWGRLAGGGGAFSNTTLSVVTSGYGTTNQTTNIAGYFGDPNAAGWQAWHWVPMLNANGSMAVLSLQGKATLKLTSGNNLNVNYFMLVPAPLSVNISAVISGGSLNLMIPTAIGHNYTVLYNSSLTTTNWTPVGSVITGDGSVHSVSETTGGQQGYYKVEIQ